ncbi:MAG: NAD(P)/FAD-dependent oxidoreductase [Burkholderiaceae bacterium]
MPDSPELDCLVIGGGAAGLVAGTYLARFRRRVRIVDGGKSRLRWIPTSHNYPGFAEGIHGRDILVRLAEQTRRYGVAIDDGLVTALVRCDGGFVARIGERDIAARTVILATGVVDLTPDFPGAGEALALGCLRYCPICDGYESIDRNVAVIGAGLHGMREALFIRRYAGALTVLTLGQAAQAPDDVLRRLDAERIRLIDDRIAGMRYAGERSVEITFDGGRLACFDVVYAALGTRVNSELVRDLGAARTEQGELKVDAHLQTSVDGLYAAGDVVEGLNQIAVAMGHAAIAATAIHNRL